MILFKISKEGLSAKVLFCTVAFFWLQSIAFAFGQGNTISVKGIVCDENGEGIPGVSIIIKSISSSGTISDVQGRFELKAPADAQLSFSYIGFITQTLPVSKSEMRVVLKEAATDLDEVVVVGYGTQKKVSTTAALSTVKVDQLINAPTVNISNTLGGRVAGLISAQNSGEPGQDGATINIRGRSTTGGSSPLVIVDGMQRDYTKLDPNSIETFTVLKDAAAVAPYGMAGANGVILITTKRGKTGKPTVSYNGLVGFQNPTKVISMLNAYEYATMKNQSFLETLNDLTKVPFPNAEEYKKTIDGAADADPYMFPNSNPLQEVRNKNTMLTNHNISISGGTEIVKYYVGLGYSFQEGMWSSNSNERFNVVSNIDMRPTKSTTISLSINGWNNNLKQAAASSQTILAEAIAYIPINAVTYPNGLMGNFNNNNFLVRTKTGYNNADQTKIMTQLSLKQDIVWVKGLNVSVNLGYDPTTTYKKSWSPPRAIPIYNIASTGDPDNPYQFNLIEDTGKPSLSESSNYGKEYTFQGMINYANIFGKHEVTGLVVMEARKTNSNSLSASRSNYQVNIEELNFGNPNSDYWGNGGSSGYTRQVGYVYRATYGYNNRYLAELSGRYDGHYYFAPGHRFGFFPATSLAWRMSEENFIKNNAPVIDNLKLRASWGQSGNLAGSAFQYSSMMTVYGNSYGFDNQPNMGAYESIEPNPFITWEVATKSDVGLDLSLWNGLLGVEADYFYEKRNNMLTSPGSTVPTEYGIGLAQVNEGIMENQGIEFLVSSRKKFINGISLDLTATLTYAKNKILKQFENPITLNDPNRSRTGRPLGTQFGLLAERLFQEEDDINGDGFITADDGFPVQTFSNVRPGDIKYVDINKDDKINGDDETVVGRPNMPNLIYGFNARLGWKWIDVSCFFQGAGGNDLVIKDDLAYPFVVGGNAPKAALDYWTPENRDATYPRMFGDGNNANNKTSLTNSWFLRSGSYLRLKNIEIGFSLPKNWLGRLQIQQARLYFSGQNVLTFDQLGDLIDPEFSGSGSNQRGWYYPQQTVFSTGINVSF